MSIPIAIRLENLYLQAARSDSLAAENRRLAAAHDQYVADAVFLQEQHLARNHRLMALLDECRAEHAALRERIQSLSRQVVHLEREAMSR